MNTSEIAALLFDLSNHVWAEHYRAVALDQFDLASDCQRKAWEIIDLVSKLNKAKINIDIE